MCFISQTPGTYDNQVILFPNVARTVPVAPFTANSFSYLAVPGSRLATVAAGDLDGDGMSRAVFVKQVQLCLIP